MCTVMDNAGTVLEHVVLTAAVSWAAARRPDAAIGLIDTHTMAPMNVPTAGGPLPLLVTDLMNLAAKQQLPEAVPAGIAPYLQALQLAANTQADGHAHCYPTHFVHAVRAAQAAGQEVEAVLFENDALGAGRRAAIQAMLGDPGAQQSAGMAANAWNGVLAPPPGDFRQAPAWTGLEAPAGDNGALVIFSDPMQFVLGPAAGADLGTGDLHQLAARLLNLGLNPSLVIHVVFVTSNLGAPGAGGVHPYDEHTQALGQAWSDAMAPHAAHVEFAGFQWGAFMVFVGAYDTGPAGVDMTAAFEALRTDVCTTLRMLWPRTIHVWPGA